MKIVTPSLTALLFLLGATTFAQPGSLDGSFGTNGIVTTAFGTGYDPAYSIAIQSDGKIVVAGSAANVFALARYNADGSLDPSFSSDGKLTTSFGTANAQGRSLAIQPDGKIVMVGSMYNGANNDFALARYNTDGTLDSSFNSDGKVTTAFGMGHEVGYFLAIQPDGKLLVAGFTENGTDQDLALARYDTDGSLDISFGVGGKVVTNGEANELARSIVIQPDGQIVVTGSSRNTATNDSHLALYRYNTDGSLDNNFGVDGIVATSFGTNWASGESVGIQTDGKIVVAGNASSDQEGYFALARYNANGTLDNTFGVDGKVTTPFGPDGAYGHAMAIQMDGKFIVAGNAASTGQFDFALARYNVDGTLDSSFGVGGKVTTAIGTGDDYGMSTIIQPDGRILVAGSSLTGTNADFVVVRYLSGLDIGVVEFSLTNNAPLIYPNPIAEHATLEYTLQNAETISIQLHDMQGKPVQTFIEGQQQAAGAHQQAIDLPETLPAGSYLIAISSPKGRFTVQVVK